ncbi:MAG: PAS domain-containing protein [Candidatus Moranbacteria bacterium]|nr:PAS domain-containing protein [Candidatus Moranbacteria bacterium]
MFIKSITRLIYKSDKNRKIYKILISLLFGGIALFVNFFPINFYFQSNLASLYPGVFFILILTLAWGWRYAFLGAILPLSYKVYILTQHEFGWAAFVSVFMFLFWIFWHGHFSQRKTLLNNKEHWFRNKYIVELPFRLLHVFVLYTVFEWLFALNPPSWNPNALSYISTDYLNFIFIKQLLTAYLLLLFSDVLLNINPGRKIFLLGSDPGQKDTSKIMIYALFCGLVFWTIDAVYVYFNIRHDLRYLPEDFIDALTTKVPSHSLFVRITFLILCLSAGLLISVYFKRQKQSERTLEFIIDGIPIATFVIDRDRRVIYWNKACEILTKTKTEKVLNSRKYWKFFKENKALALTDMIVQKIPYKDIRRRYSNRIKKSKIVKGGYQEEAFYPKLGKYGKWILFSAGPLKDFNGNIIGAVGLMQDISEIRKNLEALEKMNKVLIERETKMIQMKKTIKKLRSQK